MNHCFGTTNVYNFRCQIDGEWAEVNVWADSKPEAGQLLRDRFRADGSVVAIDIVRLISTANAADHGAVLWVR